MRSGCASLSHEARSGERSAPGAFAPPPARMFMPWHRKPPIPLQLGWRERVRLGRDYYVRLDASDYSVDPQAIGRLVDVTADLDRVRVRLDGRTVADHARVWARGSTVTDPTHVETAKRLRQQFQTPRTAAVDDLTRDIADYDRAFGIEGVA